MNFLVLKMKFSFHIFTFGKRGLNVLSIAVWSPCVSGSEAAHGAWYLGYRPAQGWSGVSGTALGADSWLTAGAWFASQVTVASGASPDWASWTVLTPTRAPHLLRAILIF